ncbi:MAG: Multiple EGF-like-domain protein 3 precursor [Myxococcales bacterium]|nr:Multiple EGF-like-domain protein 3 precursor [Myxococcales bacterium]
MSKSIALSMCLALCTLFACGSNANKPQENCATPGDEDGNGLSDCNDPVCAGDPACAISCGNGHVDVAETCDDGNKVNGDGCDNNCTITACGNSVMSMNEGCDDGNTIDGDGCDSNCMVTGCGNGVITMGETCDDGNMVNGDGCDNNCTATACGNGVMSMGEQCDDGNTTSFDGCSATCQTETLEREPNEDGTISTGASGIDGNDFAIANADVNGAFTGDVTIIASIDPAGDEDIFKFTNTGTTIMLAKFDTWNLASGFGVGVACGMSIDTGIQIRNAAGSVLASNDDRNGSMDYCAALAFGLMPGQTVYAQVVARGDDTAIPSYALAVHYAAVVCGDGTLGPGEQCDDHNTTANDGCSATCQLEGATGETEPNEDGTPSLGGTGIAGNDFASTHADQNGAFTGSAVITAAINPAGDEDVFAFKNAGTTAQTVKFDVWNLGPGYGIGVPCGSDIDTGLNIRNAAGTALASNDDRSSTDTCSTITYGLLPGQTVYAHVVEYGDNAIIQNYALKVVYTPVVCGDGMVGAGEQCDDGNTTSGDGCSSTCHLDVNEVEPNGTTAQATASTVQVTASKLITGAIGSVGDLDLYRVTVTTGTVVRFETFTSAYDCTDGSTIDLRVLDSLGTELTVDVVGSGIAGCGAIVTYLAAGTYYLQVEESGNDATVAQYLLDIRYQTNKGAESEPNEVYTTADTHLNASNAFVSGDHTLGTDSDFFAISVPPGARIRAEVLEGTATTSCESHNIDSLLTLYDETGAVLVDNDDAGRGYCSLIDGTGEVPSDDAARNATAAAKTYYLQVRASSSAATGADSFVYRLQVTLR